MLPRLFFLKKRLRGFTGHYYIGSLVNVYNRLSTQPAYQISRKTHPEL